ncbi:MAG TPA: DUF3536 domain-containing protein, partial [Pyrinomonadaceae bacterium]|nr:DUF3536 domain-containing protein [Pyrinomonadaceae bacterium]
VEVLSGREGAREAFLARHARRALPDGERVIAFTLLEAARAALAMYASCGWFFDDVAGLETLIVLRQAGRAIELMEELSLAPPVASFLDALSEARSNVLEKGNGADIFLRTLAQTRATARSVAAGKSNGSAVKLDEDDYKRALELAREAARLGRRFDRASAGRALEGALTSAARAAAVRPTPENLRSVRELMELGRELGLEANAERAQEFIYEAVTSGAPPPDGLREVALALNISPAAFAPAGEADDAVPAFTGGQGG